MRRSVLLVIPIVSILMSLGCKPSVTLYAQTVPASVTATWSPNPSSDNVVSYKIALDGTVVATLPAGSCSATSCSQTLSIPSFGNHAASVVASNQKISTDPALQDSPATTLTFTLNQKAGAPAGLAVK